MPKNYFGALPYAQFPTILSTLKEIRGTTKDVYMLLLDQANKQANGIPVTPLAQQDYAEKLSVTRETINRAFKKLQKYELIEIVANPGFVSTYKILDISNAEIVKKKMSSESKPISTIKAESNEIVNAKKKNEEYQLNQEQMHIKEYLRNQFGELFTNKKIMILYDSAEKNNDISESEKTNTIKKISDTIANYIKDEKVHIRNIFGYLKKSIINFSKPSENAEQSNGYTEMAISLSLKLESEYEKPYHFSVKQCEALCKMTDKKIICDGKSNLSITSFILSELINKARTAQKNIKDPFRYVIQILNNYGKLKPEEPKTKKYQYELEFKDHVDFEAFKQAIEKRQLKEDMELERKLAEEEHEKEIKEQKEEETTDNENHFYPDCNIINGFNGTDIKELYYNAKLSLKEKIKWLNDNVIGWNKSENILLMMFRQKLENSCI